MVVIVAILFHWLSLPAARVGVRALVVERGNILLFWI